MKYVLLGFLTLMLILPHATADFVCEDGIKTSIQTFQLNDTMTLSNITENCTLGCSMNGVECQTLVPYEMYVGLSIGIAIISVALLFFGFKWDNEDYPIQWFFIILGLIFIIFFFGIVMGFNMFTQDDLHNVLAMGYFIGSFVLVIMITYIVVMLFVHNLEKVIKFVGGKR